MSKLLENMVLCNDASYNKESQTGDPTEILVAGTTFNMQKDYLEKYMNVLTKYLSIQIK